MSETLLQVLLCASVAMPFLLSVPALQSRLPAPVMLAIAPAAVLALLPVDIALALPWMSTGTGLAIDSDARWIVLVAVILWYTSTRLAFKPRNTAETTWLLLTMACHFGAILADDLVTFFSFSAFMGYGFYGLLVLDSDASLQRAGRLYLACMVVADLLLFEALLLARSSTIELTYDAIQVSLSTADTASLHAYLVLAGFALKAGIWPFHFWLTALYQTASLEKKVLLGAVPCATALLGIMRWSVPLEQYAVSPDIAFMAVGVAGTCYAAARLIIRRDNSLVPAWAAIGCTGLFVIATGAAMRQAEWWSQYQSIGYPLIAVLAAFLALLSYTGRLSTATVHQRVADDQAVPARGPRERHDAISRPSHQHAHEPESPPDHAAPYQAALKQLIDTLLRPFDAAIPWHTRITLLVILGLVIFWTA